MNLSVRVAVLVAFFVVASPATIIVFTGSLNGANENPPVATPGIGFSTITLDDVAHTLRVEVDFADLIGTTTVAHIHCCVDPPGNVGVATAVPTFPGFPVGVTSGSYDQTFDLTFASSFNPSFVTANGGTAAGAEAALAAGLLAGRSYLNIHSTFSPGGEIRGFLEPIPEPRTFLLFAGGLLAIGIFRRRRTRLNLS